MFTKQPGVHSPYRAAGLPATILQGRGADIANFASILFFLSGGLVAILKTAEIAIMSGLL